MYDSAYFKRISAYLKKIAGGTDSISQRVEADKTVYKEQPVAQQFTPQAKKVFGAETVIADTWVMNVYEVSSTGERKTIGVAKTEAVAD